jgi:hypothetical protein
MRGYRLSKALAAIEEPARRALFDEGRLRTLFGLDEAEIQAVLSADLDALYALGANPYLIRFAFRDRFVY